MSFVDALEFESLADRGRPVGGPWPAVVVDPPRDIDQVVAAAAKRGVRIAYVANSHAHDDYVTGGPELTRATGTSCPVRPRPTCPSSAPRPATATP